MGAAMDHAVSGNRSGFIGAAPPARTAGGEAPSPLNYALPEGFYFGRGCVYNCGWRGEPERINPMRALWLCLCLGLAACADNGTKTWYRVDGSAHPPGQLETDKVACEQEMKKPQATRAAGLDRDVVQPDVYDKCMTRLGYTDMKPSSGAPLGAAPPGAGPPTGAVAGVPPSAAAPRVAAPRVAAPATAAVGAPPGVASAGAPPGVAPADPAPPATCRKLTDMRFWLPPCS
jgi:hypothetical protein